MYYSIWLLTATLVAGQAGGTCQTCQQQQVLYNSHGQQIFYNEQGQQVIYNDQGQQVLVQQQRTGLFPTLRARFHRETVQTAPAQQVVYTQPAVQQPMVQQPMMQAVVMQPATMQPATQVYYGQPMPVGPQSMNTGEPPVVAASAQKVTVPEVKKQFQNKIGAADDYSWITGQLFFVHVDGGVWVLRYGAVDMEDKFGGSVVLAPAVEMKNYREGDLVSVTGEILSDARANRHLGGPLYRADTISMMERADIK